MIFNRTSLFFNVFLFSLFSFFLFTSNCQSTDWFRNSSNWESFDFQSLNLNARGYGGNLYDGYRYVYFSPLGNVWKRKREERKRNIERKQESKKQKTRNKTQTNSTQNTYFHGFVIRWDSWGAFNISSSYSIYDATTTCSICNHFKISISSNSFLNFFFPLPSFLFS